MLIRSQNKLTIITLNGYTITVDDEEYTSDGTCSIYACKQGTRWEIGCYSTREKAGRVLDMIQSAYAAHESNKIVHVGQSISVYTGSYDTKEATIHGIKILKEYAKTLENMFTFQMPKDSEVEV